MSLSKSYYRHRTSWICEWYSLEIC